MAGMDPQLKAKLQKQRYHIVGEHGGVKTCHWTKESLLRDRQCYKGKFYGVESHNCMQMSPVVDQCNLACTYCWREPHMDTLELTDQEPLELLYESVRAQRRLLSGFGGNPKVPREKWLDAQNPKHVAISLNGEPTLYTRLSEYMDLCHKHGMTTMLVTNGTLPKVLEKLDTLQPSSMYRLMPPISRYSMTCVAPSGTAVRGTNLRKPLTFFHPSIPELSHDTH